MASTTLLQAEKILKKTNIQLFTVEELSKQFQLQAGNTLYKKIARLVKNEILKRLTSGKFALADNQANDFTVANFLVQPSYVSLESALSRYGILSQFPFMITSVTIKRSRIINLEKDFEYTKLSKTLLWGYQKKDDYLIATPEKALLDMCYLSSKGLRSLPVNELELDKIDQPTWEHCKRQINNEPFQHFVKQQGL